MRKPLLGLFLPSLLLCGGIGESLDYYKRLVQSIDLREFTINGLFYRYDFEGDGRFDFNDWLYQDRRSGKTFRLLATSPTPENTFGFAPVPMPEDLQRTEPLGYFIYLGNLPSETDIRYAWIYCAREGGCFKLMGSRNGEFVYLDRDGDGSFDPLAVAAERRGDRITFRDLSVHGVGVGWFHSCMIQGRGVRCWGDNSFGALGNGGTTPSLTPTPVLNLESYGRATLVDGGRDYTCALVDGRVLCWGRNDYGKLGNGKVDKSKYPLSLLSPSLIPFPDQKISPLPEMVVKSDGSPLTGVVHLSTGSWHACGVTGEGLIYCWGQNFDGALGIGRDPKELSSSPPPSLMGGRLDPVTLQPLLSPYALPVHRSESDGTPLREGLMVAGGSSDHTCALLTNGRVRCWAWNGEAGELGIGDTSLEYATAPAGYVQSENGVLEGVVKIVAGADHTCALRRDGRVLCWGENSFGELGDGTTEDRSFARQVLKEDGTPLTGVVDLFSNRAQATCAIDGDYRLYCWGRNSFGELGIGREVDFVPYATPVALEERVKYGAIGGSGENPFDAEDGDFRRFEEHGCAVTLLDEVYCWGANSYGEVGDGTRERRLLPVKIYSPPIK
ncbi:MAG: hypothetical protein GXO19_07260 [Epsilonproteobacteria bacterium]|nr:hypothetical protein [Campylobacterota bacterium]NPA57513.1 hypothetical protein [Campylobacterota bacterium]